MENVELTTDGLFLTLGKIMPPFREINLLPAELTVGDVDELLLLLLEEVDDVELVDVELL